MLKVYRGELLHFLADPAKVALEESYQYFEDGLLIIKDGLVEQVGSAAELLPNIDDSIQVTHYENGLIMPGFIDTHVHYPQTEMIASYGEQLLEWLENYTFPFEKQFSDFDHAKAVADFFLEQLLDAGTTTALVFGTVHKASVDAFFTAAQQKKLRMICGKVLMDRNCPEDLSDTAELGYQESKQLIEKWHNVDRLQYAITPRFAPTSSPEQLDKAGQLLAENPSVYLHTHLSENLNEIAWVKELFPESDGYLDVYDKSKLLGRRSVFAHGVHLHDSECQRLGETDSAIAFCPSSNLFLGSGLFNLTQAKQFDINVGMGSDIGAGTTFSMLSTMSDGYKTQQLRGDKLSPFQSFYLATLGGAIALDLEGTIGNFTKGAEADFVVLDYHATALMDRRMQHCTQLSEKLFILSMLGDERHVKATHVMGEKV
ncbi:guanine deaminase [Psychrosphaera saromensis]|uniref:Guanine deaminase n=1 Tax=Psychrosphaera saromensis TaxID=716813 RepID=A0A2S7URZ1_9GAMM|nr:guanine deaminase [Psychrosphaera saromensis]PQJ52515.1 guanine deaminase [Psychrosphaera saromensis]GHB69116.1 guanine deaminase [Psychrosphaera saromensis]GLQ12979.1 guanine deaminase [Psychrosphaera saromensis]